MDEKKQLDEQARAARAAYSREWRRKNPDRVRETNRRYWQKRAAKLAAGKKADDAQKSIYTCNIGGTAIAGGLSWLRWNTVGLKEAG